MLVVFLSFYRPKFRAGHKRAQRSLVRVWSRKESLLVYVGNQYKKQKAKYNNEERLENSTEDIRKSRYV